ncbi:MAG: radical SAM protein [Defluviitaleaceae bacterium]|nr:radical SAM protein [Defluviitaleaceae bacterium]
MLNGYKASIYNVVTNHGEKYLLFNTKSLSLMEIKKEYHDEIIEDNYDFVEKLDNPIISCLIENEFIIESDIDEMFLLKELYNDHKKNSKVLYLSVMLTFDCNFRCTYCFEKQRDVHISQDIQDSVIELIKKKIDKYDAIFLDWYGGEPLLDLNIMENMSEKIISLCRENNVEYQASITTNGFLLDEEVCKRLKAIHVESAQITLDGPQTIHDQRRHLISKGGTFDIIVKNIKNMKEIIKPFIRINVDKTNLDSLDELLLYFAQENMKDIEISIKAVVSSESNPVDDDVIDDISFSNILIEKAKLVRKLGLKDSILHNFENFDPKFCIVDLDSQFIVTPEGNIYKCGESYEDGDMGCVGLLKDDGNLDIEREKRAIWDKDPFSDKECLECVIFPLCMGGCQMKKVVKKKDWCAGVIKNNLSDLIGLYYEDNYQNL